MKNEGKGKKLILTRNENGEVKAAINVTLGLGKVIKSKNLCCMYHSGAMNIMENSIRNVLDKKITKSYNARQKYEELKPLFESYFQFKFYLTLGIAAFNLRITEQGTIDGFVEGRENEFDIIVNDNDCGDDGLVQCGKCSVIRNRSEAYLSNKYLYLCENCEDDKDGQS